MTLNDLMAALVAELAEEIPAPLSTPFTLAGVWDDLARLAGEQPPPCVARVLDAPIAAVAVARYPTRGSYLAHAAQFPEPTAGWEPA